MAIERYDLDKCIGCRNCVNICPMDVFRFDEAEKKSIIAYPENCQNCGMCYWMCFGGSLQLSMHAHSITMLPSRAGVGIDQNYFVYASPEMEQKEVKERFTKTGFYESETKH